MNKKKEYDFWLSTIGMTIPDILDDCPECTVDIAPALHDLDAYIRCHMRDEFKNRRIKLTLKLEEKERIE